MELARFANIRHSIQQVLEIIANSLQRFFFTSNQNLIYLFTYSQWLNTILKGSMFYLQLSVVVHILKKKEIGNADAHTMFVVQCLYHGYDFLLHFDVFFCWFHVFFSLIAPVTRLFNLTLIIVLLFPSFSFVSIFSEFHNVFITLYHFDVAEMENIRCQY